jgi:hypothetical protein
MPQLKRQPLTRTYNRFALLLRLYIDLASGIPIASQIGPKWLRVQISAFPHSPHVHVLAAASRPRTTECPQARSNNIWSNMLRATVCLPSEGIALGACKRFCLL